MSELAQENLATAQAKQKSWYDQNARMCEFQPGDQVLVLLPTSTQKLDPYQVVQRKGQVDCGGDAPPTEEAQVASCEHVTTICFPSPMYVHQ